MQCPNSKGERKNGIGGQGSVACIIHTRARWSISANRIEFAFPDVSGNSGHSDFAFKALEIVARQLQRKELICRVTRAIRTGKGGEKKIRIIKSCGVVATCAEWQRAEGVKTFVRGANWGEEMFYRLELRVIIPRASVQARIEVF